MRFVIPGEAEGASAAGIRGSRGILAAMPSATRDRVFRVLYASGFAIGLVLYVPFVFIAPMAEQSGVTPIRL